MAEVKKATKKRTVKAEPEGHVHIQASFNNIIITFTNKTGQTISWSSAGKVGFKGSKKNTPYAAQIAAQEAAKVAHDAGMRKVEVFVKGPGSGPRSGHPCHQYARHRRIHHQRCNTSAAQWMQTSQAPESVSMQQGNS